MIKTYAIIVLFLGTFSIHAQKTSGKIVNIVANHNGEVALENKSGSRIYIEPTGDQKITSEGALLWLREVLKVSDEESFVLKDEEQDQLGFIHYRYQHAYKGIPIKSGVFYIHTRDGLVTSANGEYFKDLQLEVSKNSISATRAVNVAKKNNGAKL